MMFPFFEGLANWALPAQVPLGNKQPAGMDTPTCRMG